MNRATTRTELPEWLKAAVGMIDQHIDLMAKREMLRKRGSEAAACGARTTAFPYLEATLDQNEAA